MNEGSTYLLPSRKQKQLQVYLKKTIVRYRGAELHVEIQ